MMQHFRPGVAQMGGSRWRVLLIVACLGMLGDRLLTGAFAQSTIPTGAFVRGSDGTTWLVLENEKVHVPIYPTSDDAIGSLADNGRWVIPGGDGQTGLALGAAPQNASVATAPAARPAAA